jgi:hypothetical protein
MHAGDAALPLVDHPQLPGGGNPPHLTQQSSSLRRWKRVVAHDKSGSARQSPNDPQQVGPEPFIGEQPGGGRRVVTAHGGAYSSAP